MTIRASLSASLKLRYLVATCTTYPPSLSPSTPPKKYKLGNATRTRQSTGNAAAPPTLPGDNLDPGVLAAATAAAARQYDQTDREFKSERFNSMQVNDVVVIRQNNRAGHHDVTGKRSHLHNKEATVLGTAVWPVKRII